MSRTPHLVVFAGSLRSGSFNKSLARLAAQAATAAGAEVTFLDLRDYPMPLYDGDEEAAHGLPENARKLKEVFRAADGFLIASPEYNSSFSGVLKNTIDWVSRRENDEEPPLVAFAGKTAALLAASPGGLGGIRGLVHLRALLSNIGVLVHPDQVTLSGADRLFDAEGNLTDEGKKKSVEALAGNLVNLTRRHSVLSDK